MAKTTSRDQIWSYTLNKTIRMDEAVRPADVAESVGVGETTARDCLLTMSNNRWLDRDVLPDGTVRYLAPDHLDVTVNVD